MKKIIIIYAAVFFQQNFSFSQSYKGQVDSTLLPKKGPSHYQPEYDIDVSVNPEAWKNEKPGMHVAFGSEDELYFRTEVPEIKSETAFWGATGWKGERLNTQIVIWSPDTLEQVRFKINDLKNENGKLLSKTKKQGINYLPIPQQLGEDRLARFGAYREYE